MGDELEEEIQGVVKFFATGEVPKDQIRSRVQRRSKKYQMIGRNLYRVAADGLKVVLKKSERARVLKMLHDELCHFDGDSAYLLVVETI